MMSNQQFNIIITSHDELCEGYLKAAQLILGIDCAEVSVLSFAANMATDDFEEKMRALVEQNLSRPLLILCDLLGGTPANIAAKFVLGNDQVEVLAGINLPLVLEILVQQEAGTALADIALDDVIVNAKNSLVNISSLMRGGI